MSESAPQMPFFTQTVYVVSDDVAGSARRVPGARVRSGDVPPMGGKRTLRSIRKQSVPHMLAIVGEADVG